MPIYEIGTKGKSDKRLVEADSSAQAIRHVSAGVFTARTVTKAADIAKLMGKGVVLETAGEEPPEVKSEPDGQGGEGTTTK